MGRRSVSEACSLSPRALPRFFVAPSVIEQGVLPPEVSHQLQRVLRIQVGEPFCLLDGRGNAHIAQLQPSERFAVLTKTALHTEPPVRVVLLQSLVRPEKAEQVIRLAVQGGASEIWFAPSKRSVVQLEPKKLEAKLARWHKIATEEAELAFRAIVPPVRLFLRWDDALQSLPHPIAILDEWEGAPLLSEWLGKQGTLSELSLTVGPEGGFAPEERERMGSLPNACRVSLGERVLRTESAGFYALAQVWACYSKTAP